MLGLLLLKMLKRWVTVKRECFLACSTQGKDSQNIPHMDDFHGVNDIILSHLSIR